MLTLGGARARSAGLVRGIAVDRTALLEFMEHGTRYADPPHDSVVRQPREATHGAVAGTST